MIVDVSNVIAINDSASEKCHSLTTEDLRFKNYLEKLFHLERKMLQKSTAGLF